MSSEPAADPPILITAQTTPIPQDYVKTIRYFQLRRPIVWVVMTLFLLIGFFGGLLLILGGPRSLPSLCMIVPILLLVPVYVLVLSPLIAGRSVKKHERLRAETSWQFTADAMHVTNAFQELKMDWGAFRKALESPEHFLLLSAVNRRYFNFVPKRAFTAPDLDAFRALLREKGLLP